MRISKNPFFFTILTLGCFLIGVLSAGQVVSAPSEIINPTESTFDLLKVFQACPIIYIILLTMSVTSFVIWAYSMLTLKLSDMMPTELMVNIRKMLIESRFEAALLKCQQDRSFTSGIIAAGIAARKHGPQVMMEVMKSEGKRSGNLIWQRIALLNEVAVIAPMLGLLGTVLGLFFAFYDSNRSAESISALFDGLGIAVGTTVVGLVVAIIAMVFYTILKFRVITLMTAIENESLSLVNIIKPDQPHKPTL